MHVRNKFTAHNHCNNRVHVNCPLSHDLDLFVLVPDRSPFRVMLVRFGRGAAELLLVRRFTNHDFSDAPTPLLFSPPTKLSFTRRLCRITALRTTRERTSRDRRREKTNDRYRIRSTRTITTTNTERENATTAATTTTTTTTTTKAAAAAAVTRRDARRSFSKWQTLSRSSREYFPTQSQM